MAMVGGEAMREWVRLSGELATAVASGAPCQVNEQLEAAAHSEPDSPLSPAYRMWVGDNLAREGRYGEAVRAFDDATEAAARPDDSIAGIDFAAGSLRHRAQAAVLAGDPDLAIVGYRDLANAPVHRAGALFQAGQVAERNGRDDEAARLYESVATGEPSDRTDDPAELARRGLERLERPGTAHAPGPEVLGAALADALQRRDIHELSRLASITHFGIGLAGGHMQFEDPGMLEDLFADLVVSRVTARSSLTGAGYKRYLATRGWNGRRFRGELAFALTRAPKGWQWTGVVRPGFEEGSVERAPVPPPIDEPVLFEIKAPWPAGQSFKAGGLIQWIAEHGAGAVLAFVLARNPCGWGPRGFYYAEGPTHKEEDVFAIDFTRYAYGVPYDNESGGTPVLAIRDGVVADVNAGIRSGDSSDANFVDVAHADPDNPSDVDRFRSRHLHLAGPFAIPVSMGMRVITGQRLGLMDDTGNSVLDHLHFSLHDRQIPHPNVNYGRSVQPTPLSGASLRVSDNGACVKSNNVERFAGINFAPSVLNFGSARPGEVLSRTVTAKNSAGTPLDVSVPASPPGPFQWDAFAVTIPDQGETSFDVTFRPTSNAIARGALRMTSNGPGSPHTLGMVGKGPGGFPQPEEDPLPPLKIAPTTLSFGSVPVGSTRTLSFTIENPTGVDVEVAFAGSTSGPFTWDQYSGVISYGEQRSFPVTFRAASSAIQQATLTVTTSAAGSPHAIGLVGKGPGGF